MAKFSIVIPAYNSAELLPITIESALLQDTKDVEVIVVDDGSEDGTFDVARSFPGVQAIRQPNAGDSAARNTGLGRATGEFVLFLDHDDLLHPVAVSAHYSAFSQNQEIDMVFGSNLKISERGETIGENRQAVRRFSGVDVVKNTTPSFSQCMYRKAALDRIGGLRPEALSAADHDLNIRLLGDRVAGLCHGHLVMSYRKHEGQQTRSPSKLYVNHIRVLQQHLGSGGILEDPALLTWALKRWKRYYGQFMPGEMMRLVSKGQIGAAARCLAVFFSAQPHSGLGALSYVPRRLMRPA